MKRKRTPVEGPTLAFLDIISCGLGAVILIFLIIDHNQDVGSNQTQNLRAQLAALIEQQERLIADSEALRRRNADVEVAGQTLEDQIAAARGTLASLEARNRNKDAENRRLEDEIDAIEQAEPVDALEVVGTGQTNFIVGLNVTGRRIAFVMDRSASMTDDALAKVLITSLESDAVKKSAPKWQRTTRAFRWLMTRVPEASEYSVIIYNDTAAYLDNQTGWSSGGDRVQLARMVGLFEDLVPEGGTNIEAALRQVANLRPQPTDVYIVTDGLPTQGGQSCAKGPSVTANCRSRLFETASRVLRTSFRTNSITINTVLLPMEGDPHAPTHYMGWANASQGTLFAPTEQWP